MNKEKHKALMLSQAPLPVCSCRGTRYPEPKLSKARTDRKLISEAREGNCKGKASPCAFETLLKLSTNAGDSSRRSMFAFSICDPGSDVI